ncbi:MAG TPA: MvaI/BcnI family restriction endonuclease [Prolixibacteraceae bacterium]|jgi:hypothetical protein
MMRKPTEIEIERIKVLTENSVPFCLIEPTENGLKKSIMDATGSVRSYIEQKGFHDFNLQAQGPEHKVLINSIIYDFSSIIQSKASLYRPITKNGDPRIWFTGLSRFANPNDILCLICFDHTIHVINITKLPVDRLIQSVIYNPLKELIIEINDKENKIAFELLKKLKTIAQMGFVKSLLNSDTGIGRTIELLLGIQMNSSKTPDYKGIELKSFRSERSNRKGLFGKTPNWELSKFKTRVEILDNFGYWEEGIFRLYNTIRGTGRNAQGLILKVDYEKEWLLENSDKLTIGDFLVWEMNVLKKALKEKHKETFWITAESKLINDNEHFHFKSVEHTKNPMIDQFGLLIEMGAITLDYPIKRLPNGQVVDKGCNFKLKSTCLDLLFPPSVTYNLLN